MITVDVSRAPDGAVTRVVLSGHALFDDPGKDIVCAAVSVLAVNTVNALEQFTEDHFILEQDAEEAEFVIELPDSPTHDARLLMDTLLLGLTAIEAEYGNEYLMIKKTGGRES